MKQLIVFFCLILSFARVQAQDSFEKSLQKHISVLTAPRMQGRATGTRGEALAAEYISAQFSEAGLELLYPKGYQDFSIADPVTGDTLYSRNIVAVVQGYDPKLREEYIVVGAHYDHLGSYTMKVNGRDSLCIYSGADANASGTAALLELAKAAQGRSFMYKRSIIFVAFGAGEKGAMGSWYFANRAFPVSSVRMMLNLDRMGRRTFDNSPMVFTGVPHYESERLLRQVAMQPYMPPVTVFGTDYFASDHQAFIDKGIPVCLFTTGLHPHQQTLRDTPEMMDFSQMDAFCQYISAFIMEAANAPEDLFRFEKAPAPAGTGGDNPVFAYSEVDVQPRILNADIQSFVDKWIYKYLEYPREAVKEGIRGRVMVSFVVEADGQITQVEVTRSVHPLLDNEAIRVISASPKWKPGEKSGKKVRVKIVVPVYFELTRNR